MTLYDESSGIPMIIAGSFFFSKVGIINTQDSTIKRAKTQAENAFFPPLKVK